MGLIKILKINGNNLCPDYGELTDGCFNKQSLERTFQPKRMYQKMGAKDGEKNLHAPRTV